MNTDSLAIVSLGAVHLGLQSEWCLSENWENLGTCH